MPVKRVKIADVKRGVRYQRLRKRDGCGFTMVCALCQHYVPKRKEAGNKSHTCGKFWFRVSPRGTCARHERASWLSPSGKPK